MSQLRFVFEGYDSWKVTVTNDNCSPPQLYIAAHILKQPATHKLESVYGRTITVEFNNDTLSPILYFGNITDTQLLVASKWAELMAERGFAIHLMEAEAKSRVSSDTLNEDELEMILAKRAQNGNGPN